jgi:hypothetical protein
MFNKLTFASTALTLVFLLSCLSPTNKSSKNMTTKTDNSFPKGTYGYDLAFLKKQQIDVVELKDSASGAGLIVSPALQGRVITSTASGEKGKSFGWINYKFIEAGVQSKQFNPYGGEERFWIGPEGGPFSIYFPKGKEQAFANWGVPENIDTKPFDVVARTPRSISFGKEFTLVNASGTILKVGVSRTVKLLSHDEVEQALQIPVGGSLSYVAYESDNSLTNKGDQAWNEKTGFLSIWLLSMFNPSEKGVVFVPFQKGEEKALGKIVTDDYFGKVPADRLLVGDGRLFFKTDGKHRSKIGISPQRALPHCASYDPINKVLTLLWYSKPETPARYVNSKWGAQEDPLKGDAVNSYNDGPVEDGSIMGPFYEIESSSPAALLAPGEKITHRQQIFHLTGDEAQLSQITEKLFNLPIAEIKQAFK